MSKTTPLSQYGTRVSAATSAPTAAPASTVAPTPTVNTMIVCVPDELPRESLTSRQLGKHFGVSGTLAPRFWASAAMHLWQRGHMFDLRKGRPTYCAGGPIRLLDLVGMRHAAAMGAAIRYQTWATVVTGTRPATPWPTFVQRHLADPSRYPMDTAKADFDNQPRPTATTEPASPQRCGGRPRSTPPRTAATGAGRRAVHARQEPHTVDHHDLPRYTARRRVRPAQRSRRWAHR